MIKVVIADDSAFLRQILKYELERSPRIKVVASAMNGKEAIKFVKEYSPNILILDCIMPVMSGLEALRKIMDECPLPVILFSTLAKEGASVTIKGLEYGALDFVTKPSGSGEEVRKVMDYLIEKIKALYKVKVKGKITEEKEEKKPLELRAKEKREVAVIGMASSAGGVKASLKIIPRLHKRCPPVVWVQHMPEEFTLSFAERLNSLSKIEVREAKNNDVLKKGLCLLAPGGKQMTVRKANNEYLVRVFEGEKVSGHKPSCDLLLNSVASIFRKNAVGIILTGMGSDGAKGILNMHRSGAFTIGQNKNTCTVYSMPRVAKELGGIDIELPIGEIVNQINVLTKHTSDKFEKVRDELRKI
jgi:two-component system chemotaxis response regulator CheB